MSGTTSARAALSLALAAMALSSQPGCVVPHCTQPDYSEAECRVIAENELARLRTANGVELRFQDPAVTDDATWDARGHFTVGAEGSVYARVAGPGALAISLRASAETSGPVALALRLTNTAPQLGLTLDGEPLTLDPTSPDPRSLSLSLDPGQTRWLRGDRPCPSRYRLAFVGDIQTNPTQFARIVEHLDRSAEQTAADEPLVGLVLVGDITESSRDDEFEAIADILATTSVPVAITPGNHDIFRPQRPHHNRMFGPGNHAFTVCSTKVALFDSGSGSVAPSVLARAPELLDRGEARFVIAGMHHPPYAGLTGSGWSQQDEATALLADLALHDADLIVAGHNHALRSYEFEVGNTRLREIIVGTAGASQGLGVPRFGYLRVTFDDDTGTMEPCFVEVPPLGYAEPPNDPPASIPYCAD